MPVIRNKVQTLQLRVLRPGAAAPELIGLEIHALCEEPEFRSTFIDIVGLTPTRRLPDGWVVSDVTGEMLSPPVQ
jgi:hypothetical protein